MRTIITAILVSALVSFSTAALSTHSFTNKALRGSHPSTLTYGSGKIIINLSSIYGAQAYRAIFCPNRQRGSSGGYPAGAYSRKSMLLTSTAGDTLEIIGPRFVSFDATAPVQAALVSGTPCTLLVVNAAGLAGQGEMLQLDVMCDQPAQAAITQVTDAAAVFQDGDAMITFTEIDSFIKDPNILWCDYGTIASRFNSSSSGDWTGNVEKIRYRIYRSTSPITESSLLNAEFVDEKTPLSGWDPNYYGLNQYCDNAKGVKRLPVDDGVLAGVATGIYVNRFQETAPESAYYFISRSVDGAEDFSSLVAGNNVTNGVEESPGPGRVVLRETILNTSFDYKSNINLEYYVKWDCYPAYMTPSHAVDYLVAIPAVVSDSPSLYMALHCWGGSINGCWARWANYPDSGIFVSTNQDPWDWWTACNENYGTIKGFEDGTVKPFTAKRYLDFVFKFMKDKYNINTERIMAGGQSMGGSGASMWGMRSGHIFRSLNSYVGVHITRMSPTYTSSFIGVYGDTSWNVNYSSEILQEYGYPVITAADSYNVWDYWDNTKWLAANPAVETPYISFSNGVNDGGIGWPQAILNLNTMVATKRPQNFHWAHQGHQTTSVYHHLKQGLHTSIPAFTNASDNGVLPMAAGQLDSVGDYNRYFLWDYTTIVDQSDRWEMTMWLDAASPAATASVDVTPRRIQNLEHGAGSTYAWELDEGVTVIASGTTSADQNGIVTVPQVALSKTHRTLKLSCNTCITTGVEPRLSTVTSIDAFPNPFNPSVQIMLNGHGVKSLRIYNANGRIVADLTSNVRNGKSAAQSSVQWDASRLSSGMYIVKAVAGNRIITKKLVLMR